jgi:hypothetical protein
VVRVRSKEGATKHENKKARGPYAALALLGEKRFEKTIVDSAKPPTALRLNSHQDSGKRRPVKHS